MLSLAVSFIIILQLTEISKDQTSVLSLGSETLLNCAFCHVLLTLGFLVIIFFYLYIPLAKMIFARSIWLFVILVSLGVNGNLDKKEAGTFYEELLKLKKRGRNSKNIRHSLLGRRIEIILACFSKM